MNESPTEVSTLFTQNCKPSEHDAQEPKMWRPGDPYQYPIPEPNGDPWEFVLEALLKKDKVQCDAWKDEVQNLLIFVRIFIIMSSRQLKVVLQGWFILCCRHCICGRIL